MVPPPVRTRPDRCPGVLRPWPAHDGALVRLRVPGGQLAVGALRALLAVAEEYGERRVHLTGRANLQLRALPAHDGALRGDVLTAIETTGLLPSRRHDLVRNVLASPQTGLAGGLADLRPVLAELDRLLLADDRLGDLPGRFLFTLDDGRGDLHDHHRDLGLVALDATTARLRVGAAWGPVVALADAPAALVDLAREFLDARGEGPAAAWHVDELTTPLLATDAAHTAEQVVDATPLPHGPVPGGCHEPVEAGITGAHVARWARVTDTVVLTPWRGVLVPTGGAR
ncbi:hypothetical protein KUV85_07215 [Nocardioides panacisoli]|uniref:hypothetical protein n=1 Tax=Nocardioides panacisoli TaxID=627624 RepID=UPI001C62698A|nr:hypothetical protein [Nocardioides panacisoli]QYJ05464.1 hypothetical protein KUV85_07215 [Nocardioides panacisoli]